MSEIVREFGQQMVMNTIRLVTDNSVGTGFTFAYNINGEYVPVLVTNKHVLDGASKLNLTLPYLNDEKTQPGTFLIENIREAIFYHPDEKVDLVVVPISDLWDKFTKIYNAIPQVVTLDESVLPTSEDIEEFKTIEDVYVIGYPNGLWDEINIRPLVRKGITASDYKLDYQNEPKFIIDCHIYPGSSGSPVYYFSEGMRSNGLGGYRWGEPKVKLLGINSAVFVHNIRNEIIETATMNSLTQVPNGLGIIIKSRELLKFRPLLEHRMNNPI